VKATRKAIPKARKDEWAKEFSGEVLMYGDQHQLNLVGEESITISLLQMIKPNSPTFAF
jgi:hypothetical protein